jgi:hypothetical protein
MTTALNIYHEIPENLPKLDVIVCLGKGIGPNGEIDWVLEERIKLSLKLAEHNPNAKLILSGGIGITADEGGKYTTEADAMELYVRNNFPHLESRVIKEPLSEGSLDQLCRIKTQYVKTFNLKSVAIVTDELHINRVSLLFDALMGDEYNCFFFGSQINLFGKYRQLIEEFEKKNCEGSRDIVSFLPRGREDLFVLFDKTYREIRKKRLASGNSKLEFISPKDVAEEMKKNGINLE